MLQWHWPHPRLSHRHFLVQVGIRIWKALRKSAHTLHLPSEIMLIIPKLEFSSFTVLPLIGAVLGKARTSVPLSYWHSSTPDQTKTEEEQWGHNFLILPVTNPIAGLDSQVSRPNPAKAIWVPYSETVSCFFKAPTTPRPLDLLNLVAQPVLYVGPRARGD